MFYIDSKHAYEEALVSNLWYIMCSTRVVTWDLYSVFLGSTNRPLSCNFCAVLSHHKHRNLVFVNRQMNSFSRHPPAPLQCRFHFRTFPSSHLLSVPKITPLVLLPCIYVSSDALSEGLNSPFSATNGFQVCWTSRLLQNQMGSWENQKIWRRICRSLNCVRQPHELFYSPETLFGSNFYISG